MREPEYDPESVGMPATVDPDSSADDEVESGREADGPRTPVAPFDRPQAMESFGTTPDEIRRGTPLDDRLAAEVPDVSPEQGAGGPAETDPDEGPSDSEDRDEPVGRLVRPSMDADPSSMVGEDAGLAGGGASAEEAAMHVVEEP